MVKAFFEPVGVIFLIILPNRLVFVKFKSFCSVNTSSQSDYCKLRGSFLNCDLVKENICLFEPHHIILRTKENITVLIHEIEVMLSWRHVVAVLNDILIFLF